MADLMVVCPRSGRPAITAERLRRAALRLAPPQAPLREPLLLETVGVVAAVANPTAEGVILRGNEDEPGVTPRGGVCVGGLFGPPNSWWQAGTEAPEGTYALARWDADIVELVADICASRTLWYALTDDAFLASTSQRALVAVLGSFELQPEAVACFLTSGTIGPKVSWEARLQRVPPDARITLDRRAWRLSQRRAPFVLTPSAGDDGSHVARLSDAIASTCSSLNIDVGRWVLPLSGGHDSRTLLAFLVQSGLRPRCVTWTTHASLRNPLSDASIARVLARRYRVEHELLFLDDTGTDPETTVARFIAADEGRNDEIAGYLDGFAMWRDLALAGVQGVIRGDESLGVRWHPMRAESVRLGCGGPTPADYPPDHLVGALGLLPQNWPDHLLIKPHERLDDYALRLIQQGYIPNVIAGLNGAKARFLEVVNPHLSRLVIGTVRSLPPHLRDRLQAFSRIADGLDRSIPYARFTSTPQTSDFLTSPELLAIVVRELTAAAMERVLPGDGAQRVLTALTMATRTSPSPRARLRALVKNVSIGLPYRLSDRLRPSWKGPEPLPPAQLAFRALLASRTIALFEEDAGAGPKEWNG